MARTSLVLPEADHQKPILTTTTDGKTLTGLVRDLLADSAATLSSRGVFGTLGVIAPEGLQPPSLSSTAWDMAVLTDAVSRTDYTTVYELSRLYQLQRMGVESTVPRLGELIFSRETFRAGTDPLPTLSLLQLILNELVTQERYLLERYTAELAGE